ncbi:hypothetical protein EDD85DRAFT_947944 [Armillaria nabsnona]|nr:hypothetical protein EDD85DRAFT_947944 [Armillaria nabsnona]
MPSRLFPGLSFTRGAQKLSYRLTRAPTNPDSEVLGILDSVLSTVGMLRALPDASRSGAGQSTIPFWSLLIRSLAFVCYDKSYAMQEVAFVRPRLSYVQSFMEDGHASLLISHIVEDIQGPRSVVNDEASGQSMMTAERSNEEPHYERTEASTDLTSAQSSYVPLDAHILAFWRHPNSVVLPFLCVTDEEDIFSLMGGVLYQRSTWGISEPVTGIILSKTWFVGRVVLGWLDKPAIRFAYGDETRTDASLGVYDLTDPVSAVKFSQFILGLRAHVEGIVAQCQTPTSKRLSWRSDSIDDENSGSEEQWKQRIVNWLNTVAKCRAPSDSSSSHTCSFPMADSEKRQTRSSSKSRSAGSKNKPPAAESAPQVLPGIDLSEERGRQEAHADDRSSETGKTGKRAKSPSALSCSALGAKSLAGIYKLSFSSYAHDRKTISLSNIPMEPDASAKGVDAPEEINEMLKLYEGMASYMNPPIKEACIPPSINIDPFTLVVSRTNYLSLTTGLKKFEITFSDK